MSPSISRRLRRTAATMFLATAGTLAYAAAANAQITNTLTPEGTVITNRAWVSYTDANNNTYAPQVDSVSVTVGFLPGIDATATYPTASPPAGTDSLSLPFEICNTGNGTDQIHIDSLTLSNTTTISNIRYLWNGTLYSSLGDLNAALTASDVAQGACITVTVVYDTEPVAGGTTVDVTLWPSSNRDDTVYDSATSSLTLTQSGMIRVTPDDMPVSQLPSNGTYYTAEFWVVNTQTGMDDFNLLASSSNGSVVTIDSVYGAAGTTAMIDDLAAGDSMLVKVVYTVLDVAAGSTSQITLTATSAYSSGVSDTGDYDLTVIRPALTINKEAYDSLGTTAIDTVIPGQQIWYKITVTNSGTAPADSVVITDSLPSELTYLSSAPDGSGPPAWVIDDSASPVIAARLDGMLAVGASRYIWIKARVK